MKSIIFFIGLIACALSAPLDDSTNAQIIKYESDNIGIDGYKFSYETSDGVTRTEEGIVKNPGTDQATIVITGSVSWVAPDGITYTITFIADENGYKATGDHLPK